MRGAFGVELANMGHIRSDMDSREAMGMTNARGSCGLTT